LKEKSLCYFHKKLKIKKKPKNPLLVGFFRWFFLGGFFNANPGVRKAIEIYKPPTAKHRENKIKEGARIAERRQRRQQNKSLGTFHTSC
jgi:hypothetical protein